MTTAYTHILVALNSPNRSRLQAMNVSDIKITCADGFELSATLYEPTNLKASIMIAPATGIKQTFYHSFATHLAENGYGVICFDNRGIGGSRKGDINFANPSLVAWGQLDLSAVLKTLKSSFPNTSYHLIGHSAGGQLVGLMENTEDIKSIFNFASSSGSLKNMDFPFKFKATFFLNYFITFSNFFFGFTNSQWMGMGEPLPKGVAKQWQKWCNGRGYVATDFGKAIKQHLYDEITAPSLWVHATDDGIANHENVNEMVSVYSQSPAEIITLHPKEKGYETIGHMGFFSSKKQDLWKLAIDWLEKTT